MTIMEVFILILFETLQERLIDFKILKKTYEINFKSMLGFLE